MAFDSVNSESGNRIADTNGVSAASPADSSNWLVENIGKPLYNSALADTWNAAVNAERTGTATGIAAVNGLTSGSIDPDSLKLGKLDKMAVKSAETGTLSWACQEMSSGLGSLVPYALGARVAGGALFKAGKTLGVEGPITSKLFTSDAAAQIGGAALYNGFRDKGQGETTLGNITAGTVAMGVYSLAPWMKNTWGASRLIAMAGTGAIAAPLSLSVSDRLSTGQWQPWDKRYTDSALSGAVFGALIPAAMSHSVKLLDSANLAAGRPIPLKRYMERNNLNEAKLQADNSLIPPEAQFAGLQPKTPAMPGAAPKLSRSLDYYAAQPEATYFKVKDYSGSVPYKGLWSPEVIAQEAIQRGRFQEPQPRGQAEQIKAPLAEKDQALRDNVLARKDASEFLADEVEQRVQARRGIAAGAALGPVEFWKALHQNRIELFEKQADKVVPFIPARKSVGNNAFEIHVAQAGHYAVPNAGEAWDLSKETPQQIIDRFPKTPINGKIEIPPGGKVLIFTHEIIGLPEGPLPEWQGKPALYGMIEGTSGNARLYLKIHTDAPILNNGESGEPQAPASAAAGEQLRHTAANSAMATAILRPGKQARPIVLELENASDSTRFLNPGEKIGQIQFLPVRNHGEGADYQVRTLVSDTQNSMLERTDKAIPQQ